LIKEINSHITAIKLKVDEMTEERKNANVLEDTVEKSNAYSFKVLPFFDEIRNHIDKLEMIVDDEMWPLPKYREMLFVR